MVLKWPDFRVGHFETRFGNGLSVLTTMKVLKVPNFLIDRFKMAKAAKEPGTGDILTSQINH